MKTRKEKLIKSWILINWAFLKLINLHSFCILNDYLNLLKYYYFFHLNDLCCMNFSNLNWIVACFNSDAFLFHRILVFIIYHMDIEIGSLIHYNLISSFINIYILKFLIPLSWRNSSNFLMDLLQNLEYFYQTQTFDFGFRIYLIQKHLALTSHYKSLS